MQQISAIIDRRTYLQQTSAIVDRRTRRSITARSSSSVDSVLSLLKRNWNKQNLGFEFEHEQIGVNNTGVNNNNNNRLLATGFLNFSRIDFPIAQL